MTPVAWIFLLLICTFVWGGFLWLLRRALRHERIKESQGRQEPDPQGSGEQESGAGGREREPGR